MDLTNLTTVAYEKILTEPQLQALSERGLILFREYLEQAIPKLEPYLNETVSTETYLKAKVQVMSVLVDTDLDILRRIFNSEGFPEYMIESATGIYTAGIQELNALLADPDNGDFLRDNAISIYQKGNMKEQTIMTVVSSSITISELIELDPASLFNMS